MNGDGAVRLWNAATGKQIGKYFAADFVDSVAFSPDGKILATGGDNGTVRLWDVATGFYPGVSSKIANGDAAWPRPWYGPRIEPPDSVRPTG